jgi:hypothetical protein
MPFILLGLNQRSCFFPFQIMGSFLYFVRQHECVSNLTNQAMVNQTNIKASTTLRYSFSRGKDYFANILQKILFLAHIHKMISSAWESLIPPISRVFNICVTEDEELLFSIPFPSISIHGDLATSLGVLRSRSLILLIFTTSCCGCLPLWYLL